MGIYSGAVNCIRYRVDGRPGRDQMASFLEAVRRYAFREPTEDSVSARHVGWVNVFDAFSSEFPTDAFRIGERIVLSLRIDERRVSQRLLRHHLRTAEDEAKGQLGKKFLSKTERTAIKTKVLQHLFRKMLPSVTVHDMLWTPRTSLLVFTGSPDGARQEFEALFEKTFGLRPVREIPATLMERRLPPGSVRAMERLSPTIAAAAQTHGTP